MKNTDDRPDAGINLLPSGNNGILDFLGSKLWEFDILRHYRKIKKNLGLTSGELEKYQDEKFRKIILHAYLTVPFYRKALDKEGVSPQSVKGVADIYKLSIISKEELRAMPPQQILSSKFAKSTLISVNTGGSTGKPFRVYLSKAENKVRIAEGYRIFALHGYNIFDKIGTAGYHPPRKDKANALGMLRKVGIPFTATMQECVRILQKEKPEVLDGYPSRLNLIALYAIEHHIKMYRPKAIFTNSEMMFPQMRKNIKKAFGVEPTNVYDCWEFGRIAWECPEHNGMHINSDSIIVEILDNGKPVPPGKVGTVVVSGLNNFAMPLIRYNMGDTASIAKHRCSCGINFPLLTGLSGRASSYIKLDSGQTISLTGLAQHILESEHIMEYQIQQKREGELIINLVADTHYNSKNDLMIQKKFASLGHFKKIEIRRVKSIKRTKSGKLLPVITSNNK
ncbi:MAG: CapK related-protein [archaeon GW2011_AR3]|nr:MAG: CapK related-protein [archaeon GW2011_AR3]MBS3109976.1 phenylacetate--CoA ligase family protein [Candidatus Woesearchaeota archaeon]